MIRIQSVTEHHKEPLFQIHETCFREQIEQIWGWDEVWQRDHFKTEWNHGEWRVLLDNDQNIIGYLMWKEKEDHLYLANISLLAEYRNQGVITVLEAGLCPWEQEA